ATDPTLAFGTGNFAFGGDASPSTDNTYDLGSNNFRWGDVYIKDRLDFNDGFGHYGYLRASSGGVYLESGSSIIMDLGSGEFSVRNNSDTTRLRVSGTGETSLGINQAAASP